MEKLPNIHEKKKNDFAFPGLVWFVLHMSEIVRERELSFRDCVCGGAGNPAASQLPASFSPPPDRNYQKKLDKKVYSPIPFLMISYGIS